MVERARLPRPRPGGGGSLTPGGDGWGSHVVRVCVTGLRGGGREQTDRARVRGRANDAHSATRDR
eukprot:1289819-Prymnesium_polylepis.1